MTDDGAPSVPAHPAATVDLERILRRETHSSRAVLATIAAFLVIAGCVFALLEVMLRAFNQPAWLIDPEAALDRAANLPNGISPLLLGGIGLVVLMAGLVFFVNAVLPGRRAKHILADPRVAVVVDDEVIASALAQRARIAANVTPEQVMVIVSRRQVLVNIRPTSGIPVSEEAVQAAVERELDEMMLSPRPVVHVKLAPIGVIGT